MTTVKTNWAGFSKKSPQERLQFLLEHHIINDQEKKELETKSFFLNAANQMTENTLSLFSLPYAISPDFLINNKTYNVPFVTEEPSVVAAASYAAKLIKRSGGFTAKVHDRKMIGEVILYDVSDKYKAKDIIEKHSSHLIEVANQAYPSIVKRGGGAIALKVEIKDDFVISYLTVDTKEAMGANMINTMLEALSTPLVDLTKGTVLMAILSNYATESLVTTSCQINLRYLSRDKKEAEKIAEKMTLASKLAKTDIYRASTHNKGIFNGIDAVVIATGNDWRAIESACHTYACRNGSYQGLGEWFYDKKENLLKGQLTLPMPVATKGASIGLNPHTKISHAILGNPYATELAEVITSVGLAQNFAALKALTSTGIQAGHMKLQAKSLALLAGATENELVNLMPLLLKEKHLNLETVQKLLEAMRK